MKKRFYKLLLTGIFSMLAIALAAQNVAINTDGSNADASAILDVKSTTKGMLVPRMTTAQRTAIASPAAGLMVYDTNTNSFWFYNGVGWTQITTSSNNLWTGNGSSIHNTNPGGVGIGIINPTYQFHVNGSAVISGTLNPDNPTTIGNNTTIQGSLNVNDNANIASSLTVNGNKGVAYNSTSATNLKIYPFTTATFTAILPGFGLSAEGAIAFNGSFTGTPKVFVGDIDVTGGTVGDLYRVQLQLYGCSTTAGTTTCKARLLNTSPNPVNYSITWNCLAIGN